MLWLDYFDIPRPERKFVGEPGNLQDPGPNVEEGPYLVRKINYQLKVNGLSASDIVSLQFSDHMGGPLCRVWYRSKT